jgi:hypothetical protein
LARQSNHGDTGRACAGTAELGRQVPLCPHVWILEQPREARMVFMKS